MTYTERQNKIWDEFKKANPRLSESLRITGTESLAKAWYISGFCDGQIDTLSTSSTS